MTPTYRGSAIFGLAPRVSHTPNADATQVAAFFGVVGTMSLWGGKRGRAFEVSGLLPGISPAGCVQAELLLLSYADGLSGILIDTTGTAWSGVIFDGIYQRSGDFLACVSRGGWVLPYRAVFRGNT